MSIDVLLGIIGLLVLSFAIWLRNERRQDILFIIGGIFLLLYSISIKNTIFIILQIVFMVSAFAEIFRIRRSGQ